MASPSHWVPRGDRTGTPAAPLDVRIPVHDLSGWSGAGMHGLQRVGEVNLYGPHSRGRLRRDGSGRAPDSPPA